MAEEVGTATPVRLEVLGHFRLPARIDLTVFHGCSRRLSVVRLVVADNETGVRIKEKGVVSPPSVAEGLTHLIPDSLVHVGVFGEFFGADAQEEASTVGAGLTRRGKGMGQ